MSSSWFVEEPNPELTRFYTASSKAWWKEYASRTILWGLGIIPVIAAAAALPRPQKVAAFIGGLATWGGIGVWGYTATTKTLTFEQIESVIPLMNLSRLRASYISAVLAVGKSKSVSPEQRSSWLRLLKDAVDRGIELEAALDRIQGRDRDSSFAALVAERDKITDKIAATQDEPARRAFEEALGLVNSRLDRATKLASQAERIEANLELISQSFATTEASLRDMSPNAGLTDVLSMDGIRQRLSEVQVQSDAIMQAVNELNNH